MTSCRSIVCAAAIAATTTALAQAVHAQAQSARTFEAASIRRNTSGNAPPIAMLRGNRFLAPNTNLRELIRIAYLVEDLQISGGPAWMDTDRFAVEATAAGGVTADDARGMLRAMLADRFKLTTHVEKRELQGFSLIVSGRGRANDFRPSGAECTPMRPPPGVPVPPPPPPPPAGQSVTPMTAGTGLSKCGSMLAGGYLSLRAISIEQLATLLSRVLHRPVVNDTTLSGPYDIDVMFTPETPVPGPIAADAPSLFTALQEQLGLKLNPQRVPTDVIVVDTVDHPTEN